MGNIIEAVANAMLFLFYCSLWRKLPLFGCNVYNHLILRKRKKKHSYLHLRHLPFKHQIYGLFKLMAVIET